MYRTLQFRHHLWCSYSLMHNFSWYQCKLLHNKEWVFIHCRIAGKKGNSSNVLPSSWKKLSVNIVEVYIASNLFSISFSLQITCELPSFIKANRVWFQQVKWIYCSTYCHSSSASQVLFQFGGFLHKRWISFFFTTISDWAQRCFDILLSYRELSKNAHQYIIAQ